MKTVKIIYTTGKGWVCEIENRIVGFAIVDVVAHNVWALFVQPGFDGIGIGVENCIMICLIGILNKPILQSGWELLLIQEQKNFIEKSVGKKQAFMEKAK